MQSLMTVTIEGGYAEECPPFQTVGENLQQIIRAIEFNYPAMKGKLYQSPWTIQLKNKKKTETFTPDTIFDHPFTEHTDIIFKPDPDGGFFLAPFIMMAIAAAAEAGGAVALAAGAAGGIMASAAGVSGAVMAGGMVGALSAAAAIGSAVIVMGAMYGLSQAFQPGVPKINSQSAAAGGEQPSFLYNNPPNVTEQGNPVPIVFGHTRIGGTVISSALLPYQVQKVKIKA